MSNANSKKKTFWPYGILLSILAIIVACIATIVFASQYPVYEDNYYFTKYQDVKDNFSQIEEKQNEFNKYFSLNLADDNLNKIIINKKTKKQAYEINPNQTLSLILSKQAQVQLDDINITAMLTRPHTNKEDKNLNITKIQDTTNTRVFFVDLAGLSEGRYQLKIKAENDKLASFQSYELMVK